MRALTYSNTAELLSIVADGLVRACDDRTSPAETALDVAVHAAAADAGLMLDEHGATLAAIGLDAIEAEHVGRAHRFGALDPGCVGRLTLAARSVGCTSFPLTIDDIRVGTVVLCSRDILMRAADVGAALPLLPALACAIGTTHGEGVAA